MSTMKKISQTYTNENNRNIQKQGEPTMKRFNLPLALQALKTMSPSPLKTFLETEVAYHLKAEADKKRKQSEEEKARLAEMRKHAEREARITEGRKRLAAQQAAAEEGLLDALFFLFNEEAPALAEARAKIEEEMTIAAAKEARAKAEDLEIAIARAVAEAELEAAREARAAKAISRATTASRITAPRHGVSPAKARARFEGRRAAQIAEGRKAHIMEWIKSLRSPTPASPIASLPLNAAARKVMALGVNLQGFAIVPAPTKTTRRTRTKGRRAVATKNTTSKGDGLKKLVKKAKTAEEKQRVLVAIDQVKSQHHLTARERQLFLMGDVKKAVKSLVTRQFIKDLNEAKNFVKGQRHLTAYERQLVLMGEAEKAAKVFMARGSSRLNGVDMIQTAEINLPVFMSSEFPQAGTTIPRGVFESSKLPQDPGLTMPGDIFLSDELAKAVHLLGQNRLQNEAVIGVALVDDGSSTLKQKRFAAFHGSDRLGGHKDQKWFLPLLDDADIILCCNWAIALPAEHQHKALPAWHSRVTGQNKNEIMKTKNFMGSHTIRANTTYQGPDSNQVEWLQQRSGVPVFGTKDLASKYGVPMLDGGIFGTATPVEVLEDIKNGLQATFPGNYEGKCFTLEDGDRVKIKGFNVDVTINVLPFENDVIIWRTPGFQDTFTDLFKVIFAKVCFTAKASRITLYDFANKQALPWLWELLEGSEFVRDEKILVKDEMAQWCKMAETKNRAENVYEMLPELPERFIVKTTYDKTVRISELEAKVCCSISEIIDVAGVELDNRVESEVVGVQFEVGKNRIEMVIGQLVGGNVEVLAKGPAKMGWLQKLLETGENPVPSKVMGELEEKFSLLLKAMRKEELVVTWHRQDDVLAGYLPENGSEFVKKNGASCQDFATSPISDNFAFEWETGFGTFWTKHQSNPHIYNWLSFFNVAKMYVLKGKRGEILGRTMLYQLESGMALGEFYGDVSMKPNHNSLYMHLEGVYGDVDVDNVEMPFSSSKGSLPYIDVDPRFQCITQPGGEEAFVRFTYRGFNPMKKILIGHKDEILAMNKNEIQKHEYVLCCDREFVAQEIGLKPYGDTEKFPRCFRNENGIAFLADEKAEKFVVVCEGVDFAIPFKPENLEELSSSDSPEAKALPLDLPSGDEDIQQNNEESKMTLKSNVAMLKIRSKRGKVAFDPKGQVKKVTEKFATIMKQVGDSESSYIDAGGRLAVPCYGVVELDGRKQVVRVQDMIMDGFPLQGWALKTGEIPARLLPTIATTAPSDSKRVLAHLELGEREFYFNRTFFWATRSWFASLFFKEGRVKAGDIYSRMPSFAKAKTAVFTKERGTKTYFGSIDNQVKFFEALCRESLFAGSSPEEIRANMILAAEQIGVTFEFSGSNLEVANIQVNGQKSEMDGMSLMGHKAKSHVLKSTRPYQGRALARMDQTWYDLITFIDVLCSIDEATGEPKLVDLDAEVELTVADFYDRLFQMVVFENGKWTFVGDARVEKLLPPLHASLWVREHGKGKVLRPETMLVQMVKGLFRPTSWLKSNVIIWDLNSIKDSSKDAVKKAVKKHGIVKAHKDADHVHAFLQDLGLGSMRFGTQPAQYAADIMEDGSNCISYAQENWTEILSAPVKKITLIESLKGSEEVKFEDFRSIKEVLSLKSSLELGGEDDTDTSDMDADQSDSIVEQMSAVEAQFAAYYTDKTYRSQLLDQFKSLMVELRMNLISEGMKRSALKLPICDYVVDWNDLPPSYVNNRVTSSGHESKLLREVFGDSYQGGADQIQIMIEGRLRPIPVIGLASSWFWDKFGAEKDFCFGLAFRYPVANRDMIVPALVLNLTKLRGIEPGIYTHTITQKEYFCGDTDGDRNAILPLDVDFTMTNKVISFDETKDYGLIRAFGLRSDAKQVEIEGLVGGAQVAYFSMKPGITERFLGATGKLIGGVALLQQAAKGLVDTKDQLLSSNFEGGEVFESGKITHSFASFLGVILGFKAGHYQGGDTKSDLRHSSYDSQVQAIRNLLTIEERRELLEWLFKDIIVPYLILSPGLLEVAISAQKKDLTEVYRNLVMNFLTVGDFLQGEGRDTLKLRDQENQYRAMMLGRTNQLDLEIFSLAGMSQEAPSWLVEKSGQGMDPLSKMLVERAFCSLTIGGLSQFGNEEWLINRRSREAFQKATGFDFHRVWMFSQAIRAQGPKRQIQNAVSLALIGFMVPGIMGFDIQFNSHLGMIIRDLLQITGANVDGKAVQWVEALRLSDIEKLSNDKMKALYLEDKSWGILKEDNLDWSISRWTQKNSAVFSEIKKDLEDWMNGRVVSFDKKNREQASLLASGDFIGNLRANNLVAFGSDQGLRSAASNVFNHMEKEGRAIQGWDLAAREFGIDSNLVADMFCVPSLMKTWTNGRSSAEQREAIRQFSQNVPSWVKDAVESVARIILLKREAATLKLKISTPAIYGDKTKTVIDSQEVENGLLVLLDNAEQDIVGLTSTEKQNIADWKIRLEKAKADTTTDRAYRTMASTWSAVNGAEAILAFAMMAFAQEQGCYELDEKTGLPAKFYVPKSNVITKETRGLFDQFAKNVVEARESGFFSSDDMRGLFAGVLQSFQGRMLSNAREDIGQIRHNAAQMISEVSSIVGQGAMVFLLPFFSSQVLMEVMFASLFQVEWRQSGKKERRDAFNELRMNSLKGFQVKKAKNADCQIGIGEEAHEALHRVLFEGAKVCLLTVEGPADLSVLSNETFFDTIFVGSEALSMPEDVTYVQLPFSGFTVEKIEKLVGQHIVIGEGARQNEQGFIFNALTHERIAGFVNGEMIISQNLETLCRQPITSIFSGLLTAESEIGTLMRFWINQNDSETQVAEAIYAALRIASGIATQDFGGIPSRYVMDAQAIEFHPFAWSAKKSPLAPRFWKAFSNIVSFDDFDYKAFPKIPSKQVIFQLASWWTRCSEKTNPFQVRIQAITREANEAKKSIPKSVMSVMYTVGVLGMTFEKAWESARDQALTFAIKIGKPIDMSKVPDILLERLSVSTESVHWAWLYDLTVKSRLKSFSELLTSRSAFSILRQIGQEAISEIGITATTTSATVLKLNDEIANKMSLGFEVNSNETELSVQTNDFPKWSLQKKNKASAAFFVDQTKPMIVLDQEFRSAAGEVLVDENGNRTPSKGAAVPMSVVLKDDSGKQTKAVAAFQTGATALMSACVTDNQFTVISTRDGEMFGLQTGFSFDALVRQLELYIESKLFSSIKDGSFDLESIQGMIDGFVTGRAKVNMIINGGRRTVTLPVTIVLKNNVTWETKNGITTIKVPVTYLYKKLYKVSGLVTIKTVLEQDQNRPWFELTRKSKIAKLDELITFEDDEVVISDGIQEEEESDLSYYDDMITDDDDSSWMPDSE